MTGVFVCDIYLVSVSGFERLSERRIYDKAGPAKALRTRSMKIWKLRVDSWKRAIAIGQQPHLDYIAQPRGIPDNEVWELRHDVYEITPNGYITIP